MCYNTTFIYKYTFMFGDSMPNMKAIYNYK